MNWNVNPESASIPQTYSKSVSFVQQNSVNPLISVSQSSLNYLGGNQEACMYPGNPNPVSQPLINMKTFAIPQQTSVSDMHHGTSVAPQTSVERKTYTTVQGPKQLSRSMQMSSGVTQNAWLSSPVRNPMLSHTRTTVVSNHIGFGTNTSNTQVLQNQFITSDTYAMQLHMIPPNSVRGPVTSQGNQGLDLPLQDRQVDWPQQLTGNGLTFPDYRAFPKQCNYSQQNVLQDRILQKQNPMLSKLLDVKNSSLPHPALFSQSQQNTSVQSSQHAVAQIDNRLPPPRPPPPPYDCRYANHPSQSTQHLIKRASLEFSQNQETHIPESLCRDFQQQCQNPNKEVNAEVSTNANFCNLKVSQPVNKPIRSVTDGVQTFAQNNLDKRMDSCNSPANQVLDTNITKEGLVSDIKKLVEMKRKFFELAQKIKINKKLLMAAGCSKATNASLREGAQNSESCLKQTSKIRSGPQITPGTSEISEGCPTTAMRCAEETNRIQWKWTSNILDVNCRKFTQENSNLLNSGCSENVKLDQCHDLPASSKTSTGEIIQRLNNTQLSSESARNHQNLPPDSKMVTASRTVLHQELVSELPNKNNLLQLLALKEKTKDYSIKKNANENVPDPTANNFTGNQNTKLSSDPPTLKTIETWSTSHVNTMVSDKSFCHDGRSSADEMSSKCDELLKTCLSLWKKQPSDLKEKQCNESRTNRTAVGIPKSVEICDKIPCTVSGNSQTRMLYNSEKEAPLPVVVQNFESTSTNITKASELQIAVVSPLVLSDVRTLSAKEVTPVALPETVYPIIKEGSVCSLQNHMAENVHVTAALKANVDKLASSTASSTKIEPHIQKEKSDESTNCKSEIHFAPNEITVSPDVSDGQQVLDKSKDSTVESDVLQIANICSLVEGDVSYNSQIAMIFNSTPLDNVEPQKSCLSDHQVMSCRPQKEESDKTENESFDQKEFVWDTDVPPKITDESEPFPPSEPLSLKNSETKTDENQSESVTKKENITADTCCLTDGPQTVLESDAACSYAPQDVLTSQNLDKTSILYMHDQLSELLKEFPYGIDVLKSHESSVGQQIADKEPNDLSCDKTHSDSRGSTNQIKITIISSEQMKELFPEDCHPSDIDKLTEPQTEKPSKVESKCDPEARGKGNQDSLVSNMQKDDDIHCCALGWLALIYEGVPQCQCKSKNVASKEDRKDQCSPLETSSCKQEGRTSVRDTFVKCNSSPDKDLETTLTLPDRKNCHEVKQDKSRKDSYKIKHDSSQKTEKELSSKCDEKLGSLQNHKRKRKLKFHDDRLDSSSKLMKFCEQDTRESMPKKSYVIENACPSKAKSVILTNTSKIQSVSPEQRKLKFKAGGSQYKLLDNRRLDTGKILDSERKKKHDKKEQNTNAGKSLKLQDSLLNSNEGASIKEKAVSIEEKSTNLEMRVHKNLMRSSNSSIKSANSKDMSHKISNKVIPTKDHLQTQKYKEPVSKLPKKSSIMEKMKNVSCNSDCIKPAKHSLQVESCGKSNERASSVVQNSKEPVNISSCHGKTLKMHHSQDSKIYKSSKTIKGNDDGKQPDKIRMDKAKPDKHSPSMNDCEVVQMDPQAKDQRKRYLNRIGFKCTERESICLSKLDSSPRKPNNDTKKRQENTPKNLLPVKDASEKSLLRFKLCPDVLFEDTKSGEQTKLEPVPRKEQAPVQVSGIKSTKEAWLKCVNSEKRMLETNHQKIDNNTLPKSKLQKRSLSAEGLETQQTMFQTYKKMYLEKRSRSLGNSPLK